MREIAGRVSLRGPAQSSFRIIWTAIDDLRTGAGTFLPVGARGQDRRSCRHRGPGWDSRGGGGVDNSEGGARRQAGPYALQTLMDPAEVVAVLVVGPVADVYRVTVIEGLRVTEILTRLAEACGKPYSEFEASLVNGE